MIKQTYNQKDPAVNREIVRRFMVKNFEYINFEDGVDAHSFEGIEFAKDSAIFEFSVADNRVVIDINDGKMEVIKINNSNDNANHNNAIALNEDYLNTLGEFLKETTKNTGVLATVNQFPEYATSQEVTRVRQGYNENISVKPKSISGSEIQNDASLKRTWSNSQNEIPNANNVKDPEGTQLSVATRSR